MAKLAAAVPVDYDLASAAMRVLSGALSVVPRDAVVIVIDAARSARNTNARTARAGATCSSSSRARTT
jgi:hypothetical protein